MRLRTEQIRNTLNRQLKKNPNLSLLVLLEQVMSIMRPNREERRELERDTAILWLQLQQKNKNNFKEPGKLAVLDIQEQRFRRITTEDYQEEKGIRYFAMGSKEAKAFREQQKEKE